MWSGALLQFGWMKRNLSGFGHTSAAWRDDFPIGRPASGLKRTSLPCEVHELPIEIKLSQGHTVINETNNHAHSHSLLRTILESPINLTCLFLDGGRKPEYPERTHAYTGRTCKLHKERPQVGIEPGRRISCCEMTVLTTTPPCSLLSWSNYFYSDVT